MLWLALLLGCGGGDTEDTGSIEAMMGSLLYESDLTGEEHLYVDTASATLGFQLAFDTMGAVSTWTTFDPLSLSTEAPLRKDVSKLPGWGEVGERLVDGSDEDLSLVISGIEDGERTVTTDLESEWSLSLEGADIQWLEVEVEEWIPSDEHADAVHMRWALYGQEG